MASSPVVPQNPQAAPDASAPAPQAAPQQPDASDGQNDSALPVNLHRAYSKINEALITLAGKSGVKRSATLPHVKGQPMHEHIEAVGNALSQAGGLTMNLLAAGHSVHGSAETVAFPAQKLRETIIPKDDLNAKAAIDATKDFVSKAASLIGEDPAVQKAKSQLEIVGKHGGSQMTVADLMVALINIPGPVMQAVARAHSLAHPEGPSPRLRPPHKGKGKG